MAWTQESFLVGLGNYFRNPIVASGRDLESEKQELIAESQQIAFPEFGRVRSTGAAYTAMLVTVRDQLPGDQAATAKGIAAARDAIDACKAKIEQERQYTLQRKQELAAAVKTIQDPPDADGGLLQAMTLQRQTALGALADGLPTEEKITVAEQALATLRTLARRPAALGALRTRNEPAAVAAGTALAALDDKVQQKGDAGNTRADRAWLTNAVDFGPLSGAPNNKISPEANLALLALCASNPELGVTIAKMATTAKYPDLIAQNAAGVLLLVDKLSRGEGEKAKKLADPGKYVCDLLKMGGEIGPRYFDKLGDYLESGRQLEADPFDAKGTQDVAPDQMRSIVVAEKLLKSADDKPVLDLLSEEAKAALGDLLFHPDAVKTPMPALNEHVLDTCEKLLKHGDETNKVLQDITAPQNGSAIAILKNAYPESDTRPLDAMKTGAAVLAATLKPLTQGPVGSCFATGPARRVHEEQPMEAMKVFAEIATTGSYSPMNGPPVSAVTKRPDRGDPLQQAWQYSLATSSAAAGASTERATLTKNLADATKQITGDDGLFSRFGKPSNDLAVLNQAIADRSSFVYDPTVDIADSGDGSSTKGRFVLTIDGLEIRSKEDFLGRMLKVALSALKVGEMNADAAVKKKEELQKTIASDSFINAVCKDGYKPWELTSGGWGIPVTKTLRGGSGTKTDFLEADDKTTEGERMKSMLSGLVQKFGGKKDAIVPMENKGHSFNALPDDDSLHKLQGDSPETISKNIDTCLIAPGKAMAQTELPAAQAAALFDQALAAISSGSDTEYADREEVLQDAAIKFRPKANMSPMELSKCIENAVKIHCARQAEVNTGEWETTRKKSDPQAVISSRERAEKQAAIKDNLQRKATGGIKGAMVRAMSGPQFTFADTNWGGPQDHTFFVIAPDPTTGQPMLFQRRDPPGELTVADADFARGEWYCFQ